jgi:tol-pal system protein YbgF
MYRIALPKLPIATLSLAAAILAGALATTTARAATDADLERRVARMERLLEGRALVDMARRLSALQQEVEALRGEAQLHGNALENLRSRQRELYLDLDQRLQRLEGGSPGAAAAGDDSGTRQPAGEASPAEREAYQKALGHLKEGRYAEALDSFRAYLGDYPEGRYAPNAQYLIGETYYVTRRFDDAIAEYDKVIERYPDSGKVADALLKVGFIHFERKRWKPARETLERVVKEYPDSTAAGLAERRLQQIK